MQTDRRPSMRRRSRQVQPRRVDLLAIERSRGRISEGAFQAGRMLQVAWEPLGCASSSSWSDRVDAASSHDQRIVVGVEDARRAVAIGEKVDAAIGRAGLKMLRRILVERSTFADEAQAQGRVGERGATAAAVVFRYLLEQLAFEWSAYGRHLRPSGK